MQTFNVLYVICLNNKRKFCFYIINFSYSNFFFCILRGLKTNNMVTYVRSYICSVEFLTKRPRIEYLKCLRVRVPRETRSTRNLPVSLVKEHFKYTSYKRFIHVNGKKHSNFTVSCNSLR